MLSALVIRHNKLLGPTALGLDWFMAWALVPVQIGPKLSGQERLWWTNKLTHEHTNPRTDSSEIYIDSPKEHLNGGQHRLLWQKKWLGALHIRKLALPPWDVGITGGENWNFGISSCLKLGFHFHFFILHGMHLTHAKSDTLPGMLFRYSLNQMFEKQTVWTLPSVFTWITLSNKCQNYARCATRKCTLRSLPLSYQKKDWHAGPRQFYIWCLPILLLVWHQLQNIICEGSMFLKMTANFITFDHCFYSFLLAFLSISDSLTK